MEAQHSKLDFILVFFWTLTFDSQIRFTKWYVEKQKSLLTYFFSHKVQRDFLRYSSVMKVGAQTSAKAAQNERKSNAKSAKRVVPLALALLMTVKIRHLMTQPLLTQN